MKINIINSSDFTNIFHLQLHLNVIVPLKTINLSVKSKPHNFFIEIKIYHLIFFRNNELYVALSKYAPNLSNILKFLVLSTNLSS